MLDVKPLLARPSAFEGLTTPVTFSGMSDPIVLICSVALEADAVVAQMTGTTELKIGGRTAYQGSLGHAAAVLVVGGMGKTNAAQSLTALLERRRARVVVGFGVAGAYPGAGLEMGGIALARSEVYADEGAETPAGWISTREIGIPLVEVEGAALFNQFPADAGALRSATAALRAAGIPAVVGPFATVSCCSGTTARGQQVAARFGAVCETMEGAAYAHVAALYGTGFLGVRAVSNQVEDRDISAWRLPEAAKAVAAAVAHIVPAL